MTKLLASAVYLFARHPDQWAKLRDDRSLVTAAVEELLRYDNPIHYDVRCSIKESTLHAVTIPVGKPVFLMLASANRDPEAWTDADVFDLERDRTEAQNIGLATAFTVVWARRSRGWKPPSRWRSCSTSCRATRSTGIAAGEFRWRTSAAGRASRCAFFAEL